MILNLPVKSKLLAAVGLLSAALGVWAQSSAFTYQGQLGTSGLPASGQFDLRFALYDANTSGNQVGALLTNAPTGITNGLFTVTLDFGSSVFDGNLRWLEIGVRTNGAASAFTTLAPRQLLTATPYAVYAGRAANYSGPVLATNLTGKINDTNLSANVALLTNSVNFSGTVSASGFIGNGAQLINLNATNLTGTIADARLSTNVARLNVGTNTFLGSISATNFYGYGGGLTNVPGRIFEVIPTGANVQAFANFGYLATNNTMPVVVTLPTTANIRIGETIRVSGSGAAGWIIAQNAGQSILVANLLKVTGASWRTVAGSGPLQWRAAAASGDGQKLVAVVNPGQIFTSANAGGTWANGGPSTTWTATAASGNGAYLFAAPSSGSIHYSANGGAWTASSSSALNWSGIASSIDGKNVLAGVNGQFLYRSTTFGANWAAVLNDASRNWTGVASSGDGVNLAACANGGNIYISTNSGSAWTARASSQVWTCIASSDDGGTLVAGMNGGQLQVSYDFGLSWIPVAPSQQWSAVSCSADGSRMIAAYGSASGGIYVSQDAGATWQLRGNLASANFQAAALSGDGSTAIAVGTATSIYVSSQTSTTVGATGQLLGTRLSAVELEHVGNGVFIPISYAGSVRAK
jgi:hypothetical protein